MDDKNKLKSNVLSNVRAVLLSVKGTCPIQQVAVDYQMLLGEEIPYRKFGYKSLAEFMLTEKAFKTFVNAKGDLMVDASIDKKSAHIVEMVGRQKQAKPKSRGKSRRFAPVRNNYQSNRIPSSSNASSWKPQNLTPTKDNKKNIHRRKSLKHSYSTSGNSNGSSQSERLTRNVSSPPLQRDNNQPRKVSPPTVHREKSFNKPKAESTPAPTPEQNGNQRARENSIVKENSYARENSFARETSFARENSFEINYTTGDCIGRKYLSRENSNDTSTRSHKVIGRQSSITKNSSNPASPLGDSGNNFSLGYIEPIIPPTSTQKLPRGRGRFMKTSSDDSLSPCFAPVELKNNINNSKIDINNSKTDISLLNNIQNEVLINTVNHTPNDPTSVNERKLCDLLNELHLEYKPALKTCSRQTKNMPMMYVASIKIGPDVSCSTWPTEHKTSKDAIESIYSLALTEAQEKYAHVMRLPISSALNVGPRLIPLISEHPPTGIFSDNVQKLYLEKYNERLPQNWLQLASQSGIRIEYAANEKFILTYSPDSGPVDNGNLFVEEDNFNATISEPELPKTDDYLSVVITCANSTNDISFRVIGTTLAERYKRLTSEIEEYYSGRQVHVNASTVKAGGYYAVQNNNTWMRIRVLEEPQILPGIKLESVELLSSFVDHGHEYPVPINKMYDLPDDFRKISAQAVHCCLVGLEEIVDSETSVSYLEELVGKHLYLKIFDPDCDNEYLNVVLFDTSGDEDINVNLDIIQRICAEAPTPMLNTDGLQEMDIVHADEKGFVYLQQGGGAQIFFDLMNKVTIQFNETQQHQYITSVDQIEDTLYLIKYMDDNLYRCKITEKHHNQNSVTVYFIDQGETVKINLNTQPNCLVKLSCYSHMLQNLSPQCVKAELYHNVAKIPANNGEKLLLMIGDMRTVLVKVLVPADKPTQIPVVEVFIRSETELYSINKKLNLTMRVPKIEDNNNAGKNKKISNSLTNDLLSLPISTVPSTGDIPKPKLPQVGELFNVHIPWAVNPWNFFIQPYDDGKEFNQWMFGLQDYYNEGPGSKKVNLSLDEIRPGQCYAAQHFDQTWYRACVNQAIDGDSISAFFVDYGQYVVLNSKQLQPLHMKFKTKPFQAIKAYLTGIRPRADKWQVEDCRTFQDLVVNKFFVAKIKEIGRDILQSSDMVLRVQLVDTTTNDDIYIHQVLIDKGVAI